MGPNLTLGVFLHHGAPRAYANANLWQEAMAEHNREWQEAPLAHYMYCLFISFFAIFGTLGNMFVILSLTFTEELRKNHPVFIVSLSITDLVITAFVMPVSVIGAVQGPAFWVGKEHFCDVEGSICTVACTAAVWNIMAIALERYFCICHASTYYKSLYTPARSILMVLSVWLIAYLIHMPNHIGWGTTNYASSFYLCTSELRLWSYTMFWATLGVVVPISGTFYAYLGIYLRVRVSQSGRSLLTGTRRRASADRSTVAFVVEEIALLKALFRIFVIFLVSWFPFAVLVALHTITDTPRWLNLYALLLAHGNSAINSLVYFWMTQNGNTTLLAFGRTVQRRCPYFGDFEDERTSNLSRESTIRGYGSGRRQWSKPIGTGIRMSPMNSNTPPLRLSATPSELTVWDAQQASTELLLHHRTSD